jgi:hypothetical protein
MLGAEGTAPAGLSATDFLIAGLLAMAVAGAALQRSSSLHPVLYQYEAAGVRTSDLWFDADIPRAVCLATNPRAPQHQATSRHPLISAAMAASAAGVQAVPSDHVVTTMRRIAALHGALWILVVYLCLRLIGCVALDAVIFSGLAAVSAAGVFWTAVPEVHTLGAITLLLPLCLVARARSRSRARDGLLIAVSGASLSITLTNWMSGLAAAYAERGWRQALQASFNALVVVSLLWIAQSWWFPSNEYFLGGRSAVGEQLGRPSLLDAFVDGVSVVPAFFANAMVMPPIEMTELARGARQLTVQASWPWSSGLPGLVAVGLWLGVLGYGARQLLRETTKPALKLVLLVCVAGQFVLHLFFGDETFLYAMQFVPLLIAAAAFATFGARRPLVRMVTIALIVLAGINNLQQFELAAAQVDSFGRALAERGAVLQAAVNCQ